MYRPCWPSHTTSLSPAAPGGWGQGVTLTGGQADGNRTVRLEKLLEQFQRSPQNQQNVGACLLNKISTNHHHHHHKHRPAVAASANIHLLRIIGIVLFATELQETKYGANKHWGRGRASICYLLLPEHWSAGWLVSCLVRSVQCWMVLNTSSWAISPQTPPPSLQKREQPPTHSYHNIYRSFKGPFTTHLLAKFNVRNSLYPQSLVLWSLFSRPKNRWRWVGVEGWDKRQQRPFMCCRLLQSK